MEDLGHFIGGRSHFFLLWQVPRFLPKDQFSGGRTKIHRYDITIAHLFGGNQVSQRLNQQPVDSPFQMPGAVSRVGAFSEQISYAVFCLKKKNSTTWRGAKEPPMNAAHYAIKDLTLRT